MKMRNCLFVATLLVTSAFAGVTITSPSNGSTVGSPVSFIASATTSTCSKGVASMGIYTAPYVLAYTVNGSSLNHSLSLSNGTYNTTIVAWDNCGGSTTAASTITVGSSSKSSVTVTSPTANSTVGSPVHFAASATSTCSKGVASMGIYTAPYVLAYVVSGSSLSHDLTLSNGTYNTTVTEWDNCGGAASTPVTVTVSGGSSTSSFSNLQSSGGWAGYGQLPPDYQDCNGSCPGVTWSMTQKVSSPSMSGSSSAFYIGGTTDYSDVLWNNHLIGTLSSQGLPDTNHTLVPSLYNFTYDVYFYGSNLGAAQALEFDINQFMNSQGYIWGTECRVAGGNQWDVWDNVKQKWVATGIACNPINNYWNHLTIQVQRTTAGQLLYQTITLNGVKSTLNWYYNPGSAPSDWYGITINYQQDGNYKQQSYTAYLDNLTFTYW